MKRAIALFVAATTSVLVPPAAAQADPDAAPEATPADPPLDPPLAPPPMPDAPPADGAPAAPDATHSHATAGDGIDLASLGLDPGAPSFDDKLQIYGFADFSLNALRASSSLVAASQAFGVGNVNLYLRKNLTERWRTLTEVRLLFAPNGASTLDGTITNTAVADGANLGRPIAWGGIAIERVYVEYDVAPWLTIRAGRFLTPYGIWNIDHGSPTIVGTFRPYIIGEQFFPEHQTGLHLFGAKNVDEYRVEYHATVSNGRNPYEATIDPDGRPAFGGRIAVTAPWRGSLQAGLSAYGGRASETTSTSNSGPAYDERAIGADLAWDHGGFHVQGEVLFQQRRYLDDHRPARGVGFAPDGQTVGAYVLAGHRFSSVWNAMPYAMVETYRPLDPSLLGKSVTGRIAGVNFRPIAALVLKAEATYVPFDGEGLLTGNLVMLRTQAAWVF